MSVLRIDPELDDETLGNTIENSQIWNEDLDSPWASTSSNISFDVSSGDVAECLTTSIYKQDNFQNNSTSRTILLAHKPNDSLDVVKWTLESLVVDNDTFVVVEVLPLHTFLKNGFKPTTVFDQLKKLIGDKCIKLIYERRVGAVYYAINRAIADYMATMVVIGSGEYNKEMVEKCKVGLVIVGEIPKTEPTSHSVTLESLTYALTSTPLDLPTKRTSRFLRSGNLLSPVSSNESIRSLSPFKLFKRK